MSMATMQPRFVPTVDAAAYRRALSCFATGIAVVTANCCGEWIGITINSFASVSLSPPLISWSPDKASARHDPFVEAEHFVVHVLSAKQKSVCDGFVRCRDAFDRERTFLNSDAVPIIPNCLATFECRTRETIDAGDHTIILGAVKRASFIEDDPLIFWRGSISAFDRTQAESIE